ncbi:MULTISPECIES: bifunctional diguanylate cyclase/phosphodiesterase [unclassified Herbaspirillum]|uniref:putative bifunctional diguanylate cyclase/phosphodiesterase n=1 Tax=unclassified Herbaspirillum TaxID=2624150 RepID=UPI0017F7B491|nr:MULTISPECIES: bifunctional diguanylate cyclase/phosphodiesterase [unclassified Herbaspirillum]MBB5391032.1 diguanylate cyclase (GGDEF)-like protein/PAS domain S-box-containing protein [Herbaspirillum sp. SJZ102]
MPERSSRHFHEQALVGVYMVDAVGNVLYANPKMADILGYGHAEAMIGLPFPELVAPEDLAQVQAHHRQLLEGARSHVRHTRRMVGQDGVRRWVDVHGSVDELDGRTVLIEMALDVHEQVQAAWHSRLADRVFESASEGILITDEQFRILTVNPAFTRITGYGIDEALGKHSRMMTGPSSRTGVNRSMLEQLASIGNWQGEMMDRRKDGTWYPAWLSISTIRGNHDAISHYVGVFTDNTIRKEAENKLAYLAEHDSLTGLLNRNSLMRILSEKIGSAEQCDRQLVLFFIDFDRFKSVNDTLGHHSGDQLLVAATERLRRQLRQQDVLARFGGDEFIVVLDDAASEGMAAELAQRLMSDMAEPFFINGHKIFMSASIGCAIYPQHGKDAMTMLKNADIAMYRAKERGKNAFQLFNKEMSDHALEQMLLENSLRHALERQEFELFYQPQFGAADNRLCGMEALVRWRHPSRGLVAPGLFISLAEQTGLIVPLGGWILREACRQGKAWLDRGYRFGRIAVNLSPCQFLSDDLPAAIDAALAQSGLPPSLLELEITESAIMQNQQAATALLKRMRELGVAISVDDFGTGYSSLASLKQYPLDTLKIDRSFVKDIPHDADNVAITEAIIAIAHKLRLRVVAEGVESEEQNAFLRSAGCDIIQGYLHAHPLAPAEIENRWLADKRSVAC